MTVNVAGLLIASAIGMAAVIVVLAIEILARQSLAKRLRILVRYRRRLRPRFV
jgi:hypothetical protein